MIGSISGQIKAKAARLDPSNYGRSDTSAVGRWFWEIDKVLLLLLAVLIGFGLIAVAAASPAAGQRYSGGSVRFSELYYFYRQIFWIGLSIPVMIAISMMSRERAKRLSIGGAVLFLVLLAAVPFIGAEKNGAVRWIELGVGQLQPSEFLKPFFVILLAWLLSLKEKDKSLPMFTASAGLLGVVAVLLMIQPDFGSTIIFGVVWIAMLALAGLNLRILGMLGVAAIIGVVLAYFFYPVATVRIDGFLFGEGDNFQVENAMRTLTAGGLFGMGPGAGTRKFGLPEPHTDYIFSVIGEEFGLIACLAIAALYLVIVARVLIKLLDEESTFAILAAAGLTIQFGLQALINMAVNVQIAPSKGMTLPFISYGGSSMLALSIGMGLLLAFTRRNPYLTRSPYVVKWSGESVPHEFRFGRRRHRRPHGPGARARGGIEETRARRAADHRRSRRALSRPVHGRSCPRPSRRAAAAEPARPDPRRTLADRRTARGEAGLQGPPSGCGDRLRRISRSPRTARGYVDGHPDRPPRTECGARPRQPLPRRRRRRDRHRLHEGRADEVAVRREDGARRQPGPRGDRQARRNAVPAVRRICAVQDPRHRRKPGRDGAEQGRARRAGDAARRRSSFGCRSCSNAARTISTRSRTKYAQLGIPAELMTYIEDMPGKLAEAHLVIARSGASTVAELTAAGRPAILIPYPSATDDHQTSNAREITDAGGARTIPQPQFTPDVLARQITVMAEDPQALINAAARALSVGRPHAASNLADLIERIGGGLAPMAVGFGLTPRVRSEAPVAGMPA